MALCRKWTGDLFASPDSLPFSFKYGGGIIHGIPAAWNPTTTTRRVDANVSLTVYEAIDPATGLEVTCEVTRYADYPVVEWVVWLRNTSDTVTPLLADIAGLDARFSGESPELTHCNGDFCSADGYTPLDTAIGLGDTIRFAPDGGRPCDRAFPYFRLAFEGCGLTLSVGWPAQWAATFTGSGGGVSVTAGQELTNLRLQPGERVRTPRMTVMAWTGDSERAINLWRRWYRDHVPPRVDGHPIGPVLGCAATDDGEEFTAATEANQIAYQRRFKDNGIDFDVWWIDAGWYPCRDDKGDRRWPRTGTWTPDAERFPRGLGPVGASVASHGARFLLWFEPERVFNGSELHTKHPDWLLQGSAPESEWLGQNRLLNLSVPGCRQWLTDHVCKLIEESGIGVYRQDFNFPPLDYWRANDTADRQGMNENLHVQGYLQFWDDLLERNPGLWIDSCSSGGRRNDLETMRRSVPLHYTDYGYGNHPIKVGFQHTLYQWIPYFKEATQNWDKDGTGNYEGYSGPDEVDAFSFHCAMAPMIMPAIDIRKDHYDYALVRKLLAIWRDAAPMLIDGDYYALTPHSIAVDRWVARQFDRPESGDGLLQAIRHARAPKEAFTANLRGLVPGATYTLTNSESGDVATMTGERLMTDGFVVELPRRTAALWFYRRTAS
jgi:alpha-galactosidase